MLLLDDEVKEAVCFVNGVHACTTLFWFVLIALRCAVSRMFDWNAEWGEKNMEIGDTSWIYVEVAFIHTCTN